MYIENGSKMKEKGKAGDCEREKLIAVRFCI